MTRKPLAIDLFTGLHGWAEGLVAEGWRVVGFDIVDMCREVGIPRPEGVDLVLQDVLTLDGKQFKDAALIVASPPCFVADTLILTARRGLVPIPEVAVGDMVLTHRNRWRRVVRTGNTVAPTLIASGYGAVLEGTAEHPIYARQNSGGVLPWQPGQAWPAYTPKCLDAPEWIPLKDCCGYHWASPVEFDSLPVPALPNGLRDTPEFWWMVGRWVGDGWVRLRHKRRFGDEVLICCSNSEADELENILNAVAPRMGRRAKSGELHWRRSCERTTTRFTAASNALSGWLTLHFGKSASEKGWPAWALGMSSENRQAILDGYVSADGSDYFRCGTRLIKTITVSKKLAIGTRLLSASMGCASYVRRFSRPSTCVIEGRVVKQRDTWDTRWTPERGHNRLVERGDGMQWGVVRKVTTGRDVAQVWNIEVEEDNSYVADGVVVHNCQFFSYCAMPWSRAKALAAAVRADPVRLEKELALFRACFRIQREACEAAGRHIPLVVENVRGAEAWVGRAAAKFGSYHLWGDVPALMPRATRREKKTDLPPVPLGELYRKTGCPTPSHMMGTKTSGFRFDGSGRSFQSNAVEVTGTKVPSLDAGRRTNPGKGARFTSRDCGIEGVKIGGDWFSDPQSTCRRHSSRSNARKAASAMIAKIPLSLSAWIAYAWKPEAGDECQANTELYTEADNP